MDFKYGTRLNDLDPQKLEDIYDKLSTMSRQLSFLQGFMESKFGAEFSDFCLPDPDRPPTPGAGLPHSYACGRPMSEDPEEYDKMPNLVSQESPSRTLGFVSVPLRQTSTVVPSHSQRMHSTHAHDGPSSSKRDRSGIIKGESGLPNSVDLMYPLHNFTDLLVGNTGDAEGAAATPEFMEMELDPSQLLRGAPPALQPIYSENNNGHISLHGTSNNNSETQSNHHHHHGHGHSSKRGLHRQSSLSYKYEVDDDNTSSDDDDSSFRGSTPGGRRASVGGHENNQSNKKFDCLMCGIQFDYPETLKSHMDSHSHGGSRNMRSNSEDQPGMNEENGGHFSRLMPRPVSDLDLPDPNRVKHSKSKKHQSSHHQSSHHQSSSSSSSSSSKATATKRRKRYNQSRPCSLECPECGLKIRDKSRLIEHLRGHTGERPYRCLYCDKSYTRKDVLKTHMIKMHGDGENPSHDNDPLSTSSSLEIYNNCE